MAYITTGLTNGGITTHYAFSYDDSLQQTAANPTGPEPARTNALIAASEGDYNLLSGWFGGTVNDDVTGVKVQVSTLDDGANWGGSGTDSTVTLKPGGASYTDDAAYLRYLLVSEVSEIFMMVQNKGWFQGSNEGSKGEGLSRFLAARLLDVNGITELQLRTDYSTVSKWLNSGRADYVNNAPDDNGFDDVNGCTVLFMWYLFAQLSFTEKEIVAAAGATLADVYRTLTGASGDPFPFFKGLLDAVYPSTTGSAVAGPNPDNPWPLARHSFWVDKSTYGHDEVADLTASRNGSFPNALWLVVEGLNLRVLGTAQPALSGAALTFPAIGITAGASGPRYEAPGNANIPQRVRFPFDTSFTTGSLAGFPAVGSPPVLSELDGAITVGGNVANAATELEFVSGADPYFTNVNPVLGNVSWLSQDLRVFTATPALQAVPVPGGPTFGADDSAGAYVYIQALLAHLNSSYGNPAGTDPFDPSSNVIPGQADALTGDSSVTPFGGNPRSHNYNFAIARVRLRGTAGAAGQAAPVRVFFRLWSTQSTDTDYQPGSTYLSHQDTAALPDWPLAPADNHTIPMFATGAAPNFNDPNNAELGASGVNNRTITIASGDQQWAYFGCFLNVYDHANTVNNTPVTSVLTGSHHCLVAQIASDAAPIPSGGQVNATPSTSDKLAQRNLQLSTSDNPGSPATHVVPQTFDLRPSNESVSGEAFDDRPDELMIDWGSVPPGSTATVYWPQVDAATVVALAAALTPALPLTAVDAHTVQCEVVDGVTYLPIPSGPTERVAGLLTVDLPADVVKGQEFDVVLRRVRTRTIFTPPPIHIVKAPAASPATTSVGRTIDGNPGTPIATRPAPNAETNWRYVAGACQVKIRVSTAPEMLPAERDSLAIFKWRLGHTPSTDRWYPVLQRYVDLLAERVRGLGGDPDQIPPSLDGAPPLTGKGSEEGYVLEVHYDCQGHVTAFVLGTCCGSVTFTLSEAGLGELLLTAMRLRLRVEVVTCQDSDRQIEQVILRP